MRAPVDFAGAGQFRARLHGHERAEAHAVGSVDDHAGFQAFAHQGAPTQFLAVGQLDRGVDAEQVCVAPAAQPGDHHAFGHGQTDQVGDVVFPAPVRVAKTGEERFRRGHAEKVDARVDFLRFRAVQGGIVVPGLHNGRHLLVMAHHTAVGSRIGKHEGRHGDVRALRIPQKTGDQIAGDERRVAVDHQHAPHAGGLESGQSDGERVPRAELFRLIHKTQPPVGKGRFHHVGLMPDNSPHGPAEQRLKRGRHMTEQRLSQKTVQDLRLAGTHPGSLAGGQNQRSILVRRSGPRNHLRHDEPHAEKRCVSRRVVYPIRPAPYNRSAPYLPDPRPLQAPAFHGSRILRRGDPRRPNARKPRPGRRTPCLRCTMSLRCCFFPAGRIQRLASAGR